MTAKEAVFYLLPFLEDMRAGEALIVWKDNASSDWPVLQDGETYSLERIAEK
jgi:hypothetical protein